jgi:hypothetical protein
MHAQFDLFSNALGHLSYLGRFLETGRPRPALNGLRSGRLHRRLRHYLLSATIILFRIFTDKEIINPDFGIRALVGHINTE